MLDIVVTTLADNAGTVEVSGALALSAATIVNAATGVILASQIGIASSGAAGIVNAGRIVATGQIVVEAAAVTSNSGVVESGAAFVVRARDVTNAAGGEIRASGVWLIASSGVDNAGLIAAATGLRVEGESFANSGAITAGTGSFLVGEAFTNTAIGAISATAGLEVGARTIDNAGRLDSAAAMNLLAARSLYNGGTITAAGTASVTVTDGSLVNASTARISAADLGIAARDLTNDGGITSAGLAYVALTGAALNSGSLEAGTTLALQSNSFSNTAGGRVVAPGVWLRVATDVTNAGIVSGDAIEVASDQIVNRGGGTFSGGRIVLDTVHGITNLDTTSAIVATSGLSLNTGTAVGNAGVLSSGTDLIVVAGSAVTNSGTIGAVGAVSIDAAGSALTNHGTLTGRNIVASTAALVNAGAIRATSLASLTATSSFWNSGAIDGGQSIILATPVFHNAASGVFDAAGIWIDVAGDASNEGRIAALGTLQVRAESLANLGASAVLQGAAVVVETRAALANLSGATIAATSQLRLTAANLSNAGALTSGGLLVLQASGAIANAGTINAAGTIALMGLTIDNAAGAGISGADVALTSLLTHAAQAGIANAGTIAGRGFVELAAASAMMTNRGVVSAGTELFVTSNAFANAAGGTLRAPSVWIDAATAMSNAGSIIAAQADGSTTASNVLRIEAQDIVNQGGTAGTAILTGGTTILIAANALTNASNAQITGTRTLDIQARSIIGNRALLTSGSASTGLLTYGGNLYIAIADEGFTLPGTLSVGGNLALSMAGDVVNNGTVTAGGDLFLESRTGSIVNGTATAGDRQITASGNLVLSAAANIDNYSSTLRAYGGMDLIAGGAINNIRIGSGSSYLANGGLIVAGGVLTTRAATLRNVGSTISSGGNYQGSGGSFSNELITYSTETSVPVYAKICTKRRFGFCTRHDVVLVEYQNMIEYHEIASAVSVGGALTLMLSGAFTNSGTIQANSINISAASIVNVAPTTRVATVVTPGSKVVSLAGLAGVSTAPGSPTLGGLSASGSSAISPDTSALNGLGSQPNKGWIASLKQVLLPKAATGQAPDGRAIGPGVVSANPALRNTGVAAPQAPAATSTRTTINGITYFNSSQIPQAAQPQITPQTIIAQVGGAQAPATGSVAFLLDPVLEQQAVQQAILNETGRRFLEPSITTPAQQQQALYQGTVEFLKSNPSVKLGDGLTQAQTAVLDQPLLWYTRAVVDGQDVLVPELVLPAKMVPVLSPGTMAAIDGMRLTATGAVVNTGHLTAGGTLAIDAASFRNDRQSHVESERGRAVRRLHEAPVVSAAEILITTDGDLVNHGGVLSASERVRLASLHGDVRNTAAEWDFTTVFTQKSFWGKSKSTVNVGTAYEAGQILSGGDVEIFAGEGTIQNRGSSIAAADGITVVAQDLISQDVVANTFTADGRKSCGLFGCKGAQTQATITQRATMTSDAGDVSINVTDGDFVNRGSSLLALDGVISIRANDVRFETAAFEEINRSWTSSAGLTAFSASKTTSNTWT
ncbi:MAG: hypothetical protein ABL908_06215, partial [Hyphomicrobium sp.]